VLSTCAGNESILRRSAPVGSRHVTILPVRQLTSRMIRGLLAVAIAFGCSHTVTTRVPSGSTVSVKLEIPPRLCDDQVGVTCWDHADHDLAKALANTIAKTLRFAEAGDYIATLKVRKFVVGPSRPDQVGLSHAAAFTVRLGAAYNFRLSDRSGKSVVEFSEFARGDEVSRPMLGVGIQSLLDIIMVRINESLREVVEPSPGR
jgi:hypothetical protein